MKELTYIIPVFNVADEKVAKLLPKAIKSIGKDDIILVGSKEDLDHVKDAKNITKLINETGNLSYPNQVMLAVKEVKTEYFCVVEQDDEVNTKWASCVEDYIKESDENIFAFLPLTEVVDSTDDTTIGYANEAFWASSFSEELGFMDINSLQDYLNFNTSGGVFKTKDFLALGGLKTSMKLVFWYEFLLRALYKEKQIFVIPRVGYFHKINREGNLTDIYTKSISEKEAEWWIELAKKEFYFPQDRNKQYEEE